MNKILENLQDDLRESIPAMDFHMHTAWTDGKHSSQQMIDECNKKSLKQVLFSEHARQSSGDWFGDFATEIRSLIGDCKAYVGCEVKVLDFEGNIDATDFIVEQCDLVMASVHRFPGEKGIVKDFKDTDPEVAVDTEFRLMIAVLENNKVDILGHPFGMSYNRFKQPPSQRLIEDVIKKAAKEGIAFEINSRYHQNSKQLLDLCRKYNAPISLGSNAHSIEEVGRIVEQLKH